MKNFTMQHFKEQHFRMQPYKEQSVKIYNLQSYEKTWFTKVNFFLVAHSEAGKPHHIVDWLKDIVDWIHLVKILFVYQQ